jgi:hypothetical protein
MVDGVSRTMMAGGKLYMLGTQGRTGAKSLPTNLGGIIGSAADYLINPDASSMGVEGNFQHWLGYTNDIFSIITDNPLFTQSVPSAITDADNIINNPLSTWYEK